MKLHIAVLSAIIYGNLALAQTGQPTNSNQQPPTGQPPKMGGSPGQPNQMGGPGGQPPQMGGSPGQPNQMGGPGGQPPQMGGSPGQPNQMGGPGGQPPQMGGSPGQPNQMGGPGGQPNQMSGSPGQGGQGSKPPVAAWPKEKCTKEIPKLNKAADNCVRVKAEDKRKQCFDQVQGQFPQGFFEGCQALVEPIKNSTVAKVKQLYPGQAVGIDDGPNNKGPDQGNKGPNGSPQGPDAKPVAKKAVDCGKVIPPLRKPADLCLKIKDQGKRKACFDNVGKTIEAAKIGDSCDAELKQMKSEYQGKESSAFPGQPASINN